jgi:hypothetical protein
VVNPPYHTAVERWAGERLAQLTAAIEECCEASLQDGTCGVLVVHHPLSRDFTATATVSVSVSAEVPYGEIWERWA